MEKPAAEKPAAPEAHVETGYAPFRFMGVDTQVPGWAIAIGSVIGLLLLCAWGYFAVVAPHISSAAPLAGVLSDLDGSSILLLVLGLLLLLLALFFTKKILSLHARTAPTWLKACLFVALVSAVIDLSAAAFMRPLQVKTQRAASRAEVLKNLETNARVHYVIRLIPYDQASKDYLSIAKLTNLGRCCDPASTDPANLACVKDPDPQRCTQQRYVFVADYAEVRGLPVREAIERVGGSLERAVGVSAIIFPLDERSLYPANARGLLQIVDKVDAMHANESNYVGFDLKSKLNTQIELSDTSIPSYSWAQAAESYPAHCRLAEQFRCAVHQGHPFSAALRIGQLTRDWHPLGLARRTEEDPCRPKIDHCSVSSPAWATVTDQLIKEDQIARAFLIDNYPIASLRGRYMIDYDDPNTQTIADIGAAANAR